MKTANSVSFLVLFAGIFLMAFSGSEISKSVGGSESWKGHLLLPGYSLGLIVISASMFVRLTCRVRDLEAKVRDLEDVRS